MFRLALVAASANAVVLHRRAPYGDSDDTYVNDSAERNAMYDCAGDGTVKVGASNDMAMRVIQAKVAAIGGDAPADLDSFKKGVKKIQKFKRYAAQDCEHAKDAALKKKLDGSGWPVEKKNYHGPDSQVEAANEITQKALQKAVDIKQEILGDQFAKVEDVDHLG